MKYVITGGAGFIGSNIVEELVRRGQEVVVIDDLSSGKKENIAPFLDKIKFIQGDVRDLELLKKEFKDVDFVFHLAALVSIPGSIADPVLANSININGTLNVLTAAKENNVKRVIYSASCAVYGRSPPLPAKETSKLEPLSPYTVTKLTSEYYCKLFNELFGLETVILRYFNVFGPNQDPDSQYAAAIPIFINTLVNNKTPTIFGDGETTRDFIFIKNVVNANLLACTAENASGQIINIACGQRISLNQLIKEINKILGKDIKPIYEEERAGDVRHSQADISKAKEILGDFLEIPFKEGLKTTINSFK